LRRLLPYGEFIKDISTEDLQVQIIKLHKWNNIHIGWIPICILFM
jgi:hypothetical protein